MESKLLKIRDLVKELNEVHEYSISEIARKADIKIHTLSDLLREPVRGKKNIDMALERLEKLKANASIDINIIEYESVQSQLAEIKRMQIDMNRKIDHLLGLK